MGGITGAAEEDTAKIYVSLNGNDGNAGTADKPLKTLEGAKNAVRRLKKDKPIEVIFSGGEYRFTDGVNFETQDSGAESAPITYKAADGEKVVFKGSYAFDADEGTYVSDEDILKRVDVKVRNKLVQYDLNKLGYKYGLPDTTQIQQYLFLTYPGEEEYINLYLDDKEQMISQWPNGDDEYVSWVEATEKGDGIGGSKGGTFRYDGSRPDRWEQADSFWVGGYPGYNYRYERNSVESVDAANRTIKLATPTCFGLVSKESKSWKAYNLLEEIDVPGEWFVDKNTMTLYYYPPYALNDKTLEISFLADPFFNMKDVSYMNIEGIEFSEHRSHAISAQSCSYINIDGCTFRNIDGRGITTFGTKRTHYSYSRWQDAAYEFHIKNCVFDNIGASAATLEGGNIDTLEPGNCSFENNMVMRVSTKSKNAEAIIFNGVGNSFTNNEISSGSFHAITYRGSEHKINNNEIFDVNKCTDDSGAIYAGRDYTMRNTEIAYNYIHDNYAYRQLSRGYNIAIYWDDGLPGQNAHHNIIVNGQSVLMSTGQDDHFDNNTVVNSSHYGVIMTRRSGGADAANVNALADKGLYFERYPLMEMGLLAQYKDYGINNTSVGNLLANVAADRYAAMDYGTIDNVRVDECNDFVDPQNQDYRIKSDSETAKQLPGLINDKYDLDNIGVRGMSFEFNEETAPFDKLYPQNGVGGVDAKETEFVWERVFGANNYRLVVATDKDMKNVVYDEVVPYNIAKVSGLSKNTTYYWQVWANNISRRWNSTWLANSEPYKFITSQYVEVSTFALENAIDSSSKRYEESMEGTTAGTYKEGSLLPMKRLLLQGKIFTKMSFGKNNQNEIDTLANQITTFWDNDELINPGYVDMVTTAPKATDWQPASDVTVVENQKITIGGPADCVAFAENFKNITKRCILSFKVKIRTPNWVGLGMNAVDNAPYASGNPGYFIVIKNDVMEFQKNAGSGSTIIGTKDMHIANDDKYHDIEMGVITLNACRLYLVTVDGETVFEYVDANPVEEKLMPLFFATQKSTFEVVKSTELSEQSKYDELVSGYTPKEAKALYEAYKPGDDELIIFKKNVSSIIANGELKQPDSVDLIIQDGAAYVSEEYAKTLFKTMTTEGATSMTVDGRVMYSLEEIAKASGYVVEYDEPTGLCFVCHGLKDELRNMVSLVNTTAKFLDNVSK